MFVLSSPGINTAIHTWPTVQLTCHSFVRIAMIRLEISIFGLQIPALICSHQADLVKLIWPKQTFIVPEQALKPAWWCLTFDWIPPVVGVEPNLIAPFKYKQWDYLHYQEKLNCTSSYHLTTDTYQNMFACIVVILVSGALYRTSHQC